MASARKIALTLNISLKIVFDNLHNELHYNCYLIRWVPHRSNNRHRKNRFDIANQILCILRNEQRTYFQNIYTGI